jgi:hypothetical protein
MNIKIDERDEVEFLSMVLKILRRYELAPELFPELNATESGGPYYVAQGTMVKAICTDLYQEMLDKYGNTETGGQAGSQDNKVPAS